MRRKIFILGAALSLLLCLATVVLCVRSYWVAEAFKISEEYIAPLEVRSQVLLFSEGVVTFCRRDVIALSMKERWGLSSEIPLAHVAIVPPPSQELPSRGFAGFGTSDRQVVANGMAISQKFFRLPVWPVVMMFGFFPVAGLTTRS
ncbi:MAG TPA: hypothetical protein VIM11_22345 [Tepidisphaeraceae bacterium]